MSEASLDLGAAGATPRKPASVLARLLRRPGFLIGAAVLAAILFCALLAPLIAPYDPNAVRLPDRLLPPVWDGGDWAHVFGTDGLGRDYLSRMIYGARTSLLVATGAVVLAGLFGCILGIAGGFVGGRLDLFVSYIVTTRLAMPGAILVLAIIAIIGPSMLNLVFVLGLLYWPPFAIITRTVTMDLRNQDFVAAAVATGSTRLQIVRQEILPNLVNPILVIATLQLGYIILAEASLSFLGLGIQPPLAAWGLMTNEGKQFMYAQPWLLALPGLAILALVLALNLIGEALREATDPTSEER